jgi:hypothetical protein
MDEMQRALFNGSGGRASRLETTDPHPGAKGRNFLFHAENR